MVPILINFIKLVKIIKLYKVFFLISRTSSSSHPKHVSLPSSFLNVSMQEESRKAYFLSTSTVSSINPPTTPSESSTPPRHNLSSIRRSISMSNFAVCLLTGSSETIFAKRLHPSASEFWYENQIRDGPLYGFIYFMEPVITFLTAPNSSLFKLGYFPTLIQSNRFFKRCYICCKSDFIHIILRFHGFS